MSAWPLRVLLLAVLVLASGLNSAAVAAPPAGTEWVPFEPLTDEFDNGGLDQSKWFDRNPHWKGRHPVFFHPEGVSVSGGMLRLKALTPEEDLRKRLPKGYTCVCGYVRSKQAIRFGYFEVRAKLMDGPYPSCFWLSNHQKEEWSEIDCVEIPAGVDEYSQVFQPNLHYFHGPHYQGVLRDHWASPSKHPLPFRTADDFHVYGVEWNRNHIRWYVDGEMIRESKNQTHFQPLYMSINLESNPWFGEQPKDPDGKGSYQIDWVRSWRPAGEELE